MRLLSDLWAVAPRRAALLAALLLLTSIAEAVAAALAGPMLDRPSGPLFLLLALTLATAGVALLSRQLVATRHLTGWSSSLRGRLCSAALGQDLPTLEATPAGELLDRIDIDVHQLANNLRNSGLTLVQAGLTGLVSVITALVIWWPAGVALIVVLVVTGYLLRHRFSALAPARAHEEEAWSDLAAVMEEAIHGQDDVRTSLARPYVLQLHADRTREVLDRGRRVWRLSARFLTLAGGSVRIALALLVVGGAVALQAGGVSDARLTSVWLLGAGLVGATEQLGHHLTETQNALGAWARIGQLAGSPQERSGTLTPSEGEVTIRDLTFRYPSGPDRAALDRIDLRFEPGRSYAVVGRTGSGKSTLAKILTRSVEVPPGTVFLDGLDLCDLDLTLLRRRVALVPQQTEIMAGSLLDNVALFDPDLHDRATEALAELGLEEWMAALPDGVDTRIGEGGQMLSAGQAQLVAFARVLVRSPHIVILDEATARLDPVSEEQVRRATERLVAGRIGIVIAHRLSTVERCDDVVVMADGRVVESGPLVDSTRFAELLAASRDTGLVTAGTRVTPPHGDRHGPDPDGDGSGPDGEGTDTDGAGRDRRDGGRRNPVSVAGSTLKVDPPPLPPDPPVRTVREVLRITVNDPRYGLGAMAVFFISVLLSLDSPVIAWVWTRVVDGAGDPRVPAAALAALIVVRLPFSELAHRWFPEWFVRQMLRIGIRLVHGQTGPTRISGHTPAEVVAQSGDTERVVQLADHVYDLAVAAEDLLLILVVSRSPVVAALFLAAIGLAALAAVALAPGLTRAAERTVAARAAFATALSSALGAARTVKLAAATGPVLAHLTRLERERSDALSAELNRQVMSRSTSLLSSRLLPVGAWGLYLSGRLSATAVLVAVGALRSANWYSWCAASLVSQAPSARVWTRRTTAMCGIADYTAAIPGVDISAGTAPAPAASPRLPLEHLALSEFSAVHTDGTVGITGVDLTVTRGQLVLLVGPVGSGKSSLLRGLAGIVHHDGEVRWNGELVTEPEVFLRPGQVGYVAQLPRVLSGTVADNIALGHDRDPSAAVAAAQLDHDLAVAGGGLGLLVGHKGTRLSGGQLQRLALARALATECELLVADDVSSALDVTTELDLWRELRDRGATVIGSTSKRAALSRADHVVVLDRGTVVEQGAWTDLADRWGHLAG